jgi:hypothetical protein
MGLTLIVSFTVLTLLQSVRTTGDSRDVWLTPHAVRQLVSVALGAQRENNRVGFVQGLLMSANDRWRLVRRAKADDWDKGETRGGKAANVNAAIARAQGCRRPLGRIDCDPLSRARLLSII